MATSTSNHHLAPPSTSNMGLPISNGNGLGDVPSPPLSPGKQHPPPSPRTHSKSILTIALQKAQSAVLLDSANNVSAALAAYRQTVKLLLQVIDKAANETDRRRLQHIYDTYADRIRLLSTIAPQNELDDNNDDDSGGGGGRNKDDEFDNCGLQNRASYKRINDESESRHRRKSKRNSSSTINLNGVIHRNDDHDNNNDSIKSGTIKSSIDNVKNHPHNNTDIDNSLLALSPNNHKRRTHKSNSSTSTTKSWNSSRMSLISDKTTPPGSDYESAIEKRESIGESTESVEALNSSDDTASSTDDATTSNNDNNNNTRKNIHKNSLSSSSSSSLPISMDNNRSTAATVTATMAGPIHNSSLTKDNSSLPSSSSSKKSPKSLLLLSTRSKSPDKMTSIKKNDKNISKKSKSPEFISSSLSKNINTSDNNKQDESLSIKLNNITPPNDTAASMKSQKTITTSSPSFNSRRPSPLSLTQENDSYNSRTIPVLGDTASSNPLASSSVTTTTTNPHNATTTQSLGLIGAVPPRRAASNPGQPRKNNSNQMLSDDVLGQPNKTGLPEPPPTDVHLRPFWLMRTLERTMTTGGYLTKKLFVPNNMWVQANVKLASVETKVSSCELIHNCLVRLEKTTIDDLDSLVKELDSIETDFDGIQNSLARKLSYVESTNGKSRQNTALMNWGSKLSQRLDRMGMGNVANRSEEANNYVEMLLKVFQNAHVV
ncbi:5887_t:CDS:2, partial [Ambispora leptoticha]